MSKVWKLWHAGSLDKDFQLLYTLGRKDVGLTALMHRPAGAAKGHFMLLLSPRASTRLRDLAKPQNGILLLIGPEGGLAPEETQHVVERYQPRPDGKTINYTATISNPKTVSPLTDTFRLNTCMSSLGSCRGWEPGARG
jgi:hypothetical protein